MSTGKANKPLIDGKARRFSAPSRGRAVRRPEDVVRDVRGLKLRQRVSLVLNDKVLRDELEDLVQTYVQNGPKSSGEGVRTYQDFLIPSSSYYGGGMSAVVTPIADIRGSDTLNYSKQERLLRCKLASTYRLVDLFGWNTGLYSFITIRPSADQESFLIHPFGLLYNEVTASSLLKVNPDGSVVDQGSTNLGVNKAGMLLHSAIHGARKDARAIIHLHQDAIVAVSAMKCGLLPICIEALSLGEIAYHDFRGIFSNEEEKESIVKDLGEESKAMILRNHGIVVCGETIEEAFSLAQSAVKACSFQVKAVAAGVDNLIKCEDFARDQVKETTQEGGGGVNSSEMKWKRGEMEFEAYMRLLDSMGYKSGYIYRNPELFHGEKPAEREVTTPSTVSSTRAKLYYTPEIERTSVRRAHSTGRANTYRNRVKWLNTPVKSTEYKKDKEKVELESDEPVTIKDLIPERVDKDLEQTPENKEVIVKSSKVVITESVHVEKGINGDETKESKTVVVTTEVNGDAGDEKSTEDGDEDGADGELLAPNADSPEPESPTKKKGTKVKKKKSFKDALVKKFSKKGERPTKYEKTDGEKAD
ncbi:alpha-adducin-like [Orbicella faveolata]|uniref:alpha-adducin-like n=1 Tax=Orbicella faveolata TaxID=48498 RepID=UPI0009E1BA69|nr:alpha-adducin-like [Orbicella faveolata]